MEYIRITNENIEKEPIDVNTQELRKFEEEEN